MSSITDYANKPLRYYAKRSRKKARHPIPRDKFGLNWLIGGPVRSSKYDHLKLPELQEKWDMVEKRLAMYDGLSHQWAVERVALLLEEQRHIRNAKDWMNQVPTEE